LLLFFNLNYLLFLFKLKKNNLYIIYINKDRMGIGDWGLGIGDWGLGIGPNPQSAIPNPQSPNPIKFINLKFFI